jgi:hypothetical protein
VYNHAMSNLPSGLEWSPADNPYAIAVSEATWWRCAVKLAVARLGDPVDRRAAPLNSTQIDARNLVFALVQLLAAERLEQKALRELGVDAIVGDVLSRARDRYLGDLPDIQEMRNSLTHFDDWAMGRGRGLQRADVTEGSEPRDVAGHYWGFGYNPTERVVRLGPFKIEVAKAVPAALGLERAICAAAGEVDRQAELANPADDSCAPGGAWDRDSLGPG